jgi:hypothetical protein
MHFQHIPWEDRDMKKWLLFIASLLLAASTGRSQEAPKKTDAPAINALGWLVGGVWTADATKLAPGMQRIETRYQWSDNKAFLRFTTHFVFDKSTANTYDGNFFWKADGNTLAMWYMNSKGEILEGPMQWDGTVLRILFRGEDFEGKMADLKVEVTRKWAVFEKNGEGWKELFGLEYLRVG